MKVKWSKMEIKKYKVKWNIETIRKCYEEQAPLQYQSRKITNDIINGLSTIYKSQRTLYFCLVNLQESSLCFTNIKCYMYIFIILGAATIQRQTTVTRFIMISQFLNVIFKIFVRYFVWNFWYFNIVSFVILF